MSENNGAITSSPLQSEEVKVHPVQILSDHMLNTELPTTGQYLLTFLSNDCQVLPFNDFKVYKTTKYAAFKRLVENRDIVEQHVHTLMESFRKDGYLFTMLYVNEKMELIDGQHRFEAAKRMHLPAYFIIMPSWGIKEVAILNVNSRNWTMEDFMNTHAKSGNKNYVRFKEFYDEFEFDITTAQLIILGRRSKHGGTTDEFRSGKMEVTEVQITKAYIKARKIRNFKDFHPHGYKCRNFVESILSIMNIKGYDHNHMIEQLKKYPETMLIDARSLRVEEYQKMFIEKYNHRRRDKIELA